MIQSAFRSAFASAFGLALPVGGAPFHYITQFDAGDAGSGTLSLGDTRIANITTNEYGKLSLVAPAGIDDIRVRWEINAGIGFAPGIHDVGTGLLLANHYETTGIFSWTNTSDVTAATGFTGTGVDYEIRVNRATGVMEFFIAGVSQGVKTDGKLATGDMLFKVYETSATKSTLTLLPAP